MGGIGWPELILCGGGVAFLALLVLVAVLLVRLIRNR